MSNSKKFRTSHSDLVKNVKATCLRYGIPEPDAFLAEVMAGRDPRHDTSPLYDLVRSITAGRLPDEDEWRDICEIVLEDPAYKPARVSANTSIAAAQKLVDHLYPKLKALEITTEDVTAGPVTKLTPEEITAFKKAVENDDSF